MTSLSLLLVAVALCQLPTSAAAGGALEVAAAAGTWPATQPAQPSPPPPSPPQLDWGAHRASVTVHPRTSTPLAAATPRAVLVELEWRRRDVLPQSKDVRVTYRSSATDGKTQCSTSTGLIIVLPHDPRCVRQCLAGNGVQLSPRATVCVNVSCCFRAFRPKSVRSLSLFLPLLALLRIAPLVR